MLTAYWETVEATNKRARFTVRQLTIASIFLVVFGASLITYTIVGSVTWGIRVRVFDQEGNKVEGAYIATMWSANGPTWYDYGIKREIDGEIVEMDSLSDVSLFWRDEGMLMPYPNSSAKALGDGVYGIKGIRGESCAVFATNPECTLGACAEFKKQLFTQTITLRLKPLVRVNGNFTCPQVNRVPDWTMAAVHFSADSRNEKGFLRCGSLEGKFSFLLPPGEYDLRAYSESPNAELPKSLARISVPIGKGTVDLGTMELKFPENRGDYSSYYGKAPPPLDVTDGIGVSSNIGLDSLLGKWVLLEFWSPSCGPCIGESLPKLRDLCIKYASHRDRFEVLAICSADERYTSYDVFTHHYQRVIRSTWDGADLPFPVLFDGEGKTKKSYGVTYLPTALLIDPEGKLVKWGDAAMLEEKLDAMKCEEDKFRN